MRSNSFVKGTLPCLAVIVVLLGQVTVATAAESVGRSFSSIDTAIEKASSNKAFSIESDFLQKVLIDIQKSSVSNFDLTSLRKSSTVMAEKEMSVHTDSHTEIVNEYTEKGLVFKLRYDDVALKNPQVLIKDLAVLSVITSSSGNEINNSYFRGKKDAQLTAELDSPHAMAELLANVREGSPTAKARWLKIQDAILKNVGLKPQGIQDLQVSSNVMQEIRESLNVQLTKAEALAKQHERKQAKALSQWKSETGALDKLEAMQEKLDDLIMKNDRKGVRMMLEAYLPWAVMEPVEANTWKIWLEAIENPDVKNTTVAFRGLKYDTDKIQRRKTSQGEIYGFMSTVLTKNQGSYTRRLRSLTTNREKNGDLGFKAQKNMKEKSYETMSVKITDQMTAHARNPVASSFISFTYDPGVARRFMGDNITKNINGEKVSTPYGGILVVNMDSRRVVPNIPSMFSNEIELLAPLIVFPDEVVAYKEGSFDQKYTYQMFIEDISKKTGIDFMAWSSAKNSNDVTLRQRYNSEGHAFLGRMTNLSSNAKSCSKVF